MRPPVGADTFRVTYVVRDPSFHEDIWLGWTSSAPTARGARKAFRAWSASAHVGVTIGAVKVRIVSVEPVVAPVATLGDEDGQPS